MIAIYGFIWIKHVNKINVYFSTVHILGNFLIPAAPLFYMQVLNATNEYSVGELSWQP